MRFPEKEFICLCLSCLGAVDPRVIHSGPRLKAHSLAGSNGARAHVSLLDLSRLILRDLNTNQDLTWCCSSREVKCQVKYAATLRTLWCSGRLWIKKNLCNEDLGLLHPCLLGREVSGVPFALHLEDHFLLDDFLQRFHHQRGSRSADAAGPITTHLASASGRTCAAVATV